MARKEGGAWRGDVKEGGRDVSRRALAHLRGHTKEGRFLCPAMLRSWLAKEPPSSPPHPEIQPGVPNLLPQMPSSSPQGLSEVDLSELESPGVPSGGSPMALGKPNGPQHPGSCRPPELPLSAPGRPVPEFWKPQTCKGQTSALLITGVGEGRKGGALACV